MKTRTSTPKATADTITRLSSEVEAVRSIAGGYDNPSTRRPIYVESVAALKAQSVASLPNGAVFVTKGYYSSGDGGAGEYVYNSASSATDNGGTVIAPTAGAGRYLLFSSNPISVLQFGAIGNGAANDSASFNNAFSAVRTLFVPARTYRIGGSVQGGTSLNIPSNFRLIGEVGAKLAVDRGDGSYTANCIRINNVSNVEISNLEIYSTVTAMGQTTTGIIVVGTSAVPKNITINNCIFHDLTTGVIAGGSGVFRPSEISIIGCIAYSCANNGMSTSFGDSVKYLRCNCYSNGTPSGAGYGIDVESNAGESIDYVSIIQCTLTSNLTGGIGVVSGSISNVTIDSNSTISNPIGINVNGLSSSYVSNVVISNNNTSQSSSKGISVARARSITIDGNVVRDSIQLISCIDGVVSNNTVSGSSDGIECSSAGFSYGLCFSSNSVSNCGGSGLNIFANNSTITGNLVQKSGNSGISVTGSNNVIVSNDVAGSGNSAFGTWSGVGCGTGIQSVVSNNKLTKFSNFSTGTAQAGADSTITLQSTESGVANAYNGLVVGIVSGTGVGQLRTIDSYSASRVATVSSNWDVIPDATSIYEIGDCSVWSVSKTAQSGGASTITLPASFSGTSTFYVGGYLKITGGTGVGQNALITAYNGVTKVATVSAAWSVVPDNTSTFLITVPNGTWRGIVLTGTQTQVNNNELSNSAMATQLLNAGTNSVVQPKFFLSPSSPTFGQNNVGDVAFNSSPAIGLPTYWVCRVSGNPGTWTAGPNL